MHSRALLVVVLAMCGCGGLSPSEQGHLQQTVRAMGAFQQALALANSMIDFQRVLDPGKTAEENAAAILDRTTFNLDGCGSTSQPSPLMLSTSFGPAPGCTLRTGARVSGDVNVLIDSYVTSVALSPSGVAANEKRLDGLWYIRTTATPGLHVLGGSLQSQAPEPMSLTVSMGVLARSAEVLSLSGKGDVTGGSIGTTFVASDVTWTPGACFPDGGSIQLTGGVEGGFRGLSQVSLDVLLELSGDTRDTGQIAVTVRGETTIERLPGYGACPR